MYQQTMAPIPNSFVLKRYNQLIGLFILFHLIGLASSSNDDAVIQEEDDEVDKHCIDRDPNCRSWARSGECRKDAAFSYMKVNCAVSCNYCNPLLERWEPLDKNGENGKSYLTSQYDRVPIYHGVAQQTNFTDSAFTDEPIELVDGSTMPRDEYIQLRIKDILVAMNAYLEFLYTDEISFVSKEGYQVDDSTPYATMRAYSPVDIESAPWGARIPQLESCINRHPYCALWAALGYCDSSKVTMEQMCSPVCQSCELNIPYPYNVQLDSDTWLHSPFDRLDLHGILERINEDRIVVHSFDDIKQYFPSDMKLESRKKGTHISDDVRYLNVEGLEISMHTVRRSEKDRKIYRKALELDGSASEFSSFISIFDLLTPEDCQGLLDTVSFGVGVDTRKHGKTAKDGFPKKTTDTYQRDGDDTPVVQRSSSRVFVYPSIRSNDGSMKYSNALERLIAKVQLMTGFEAVERVESPIIFEKFEAGDFQKPSRHFRSGILSSEGNQFEEYVMVNEGEQYDDMNKPDMMENARLFGLTVCLKGLNQIGSGGALYFPHFPSRDFHPYSGAGILFPTVASLIENDVEFYDVPPLDENLDHNGVDSSFLVEDLYTTFGRRPVKEGTYYTVTIYFRRYESDERLQG